MKRVYSNPRLLLGKILFILAINLSGYLATSAELSGTPLSTEHPPPLLAGRDTGCLNCHSKTIPTTPPTCKSCHQECTPEKNLVPGQSESQNHKPNQKESCLTCHEVHFLPQHYGKHCQQCHQTSSWEVTTEFIASNRSCISCHEKEIPPHHYMRTTCFFCHQSSSWQHTSFEHIGFERCERCHTRPKRHRPGDCIFCHDTIDWGNAS